MPHPKPLILIILDGWGYRAETKANAIALARKPTYDRLLREYPNTLIHTSGPFVGLPEGQMGNSEVGHLNIGAGRIVHMDITRIDLMIQNGEFFLHPVLVEAMKNARTSGRKLHLFGLLSDGGVHSRQEHLYALLKMAKQQGVDRVFVHAFMDEDAVYALLLRHFEERVEMLLARMHSAIGEQAEEVEFAAAGAGILHRFDEHRMQEEFAV